MIKVSELSGVWLDFWVATLRGYECEVVNGECGVYDTLWSGVWNGKRSWKTFSPSTIWWGAGNIIEVEKIQITPRKDGFWQARKVFGDKTNYPIYVAPTPLVAAMRAYVGANLGEEIND